MREASAIMAKASKAVKGKAKLAELEKTLKAAIKAEEKASGARVKAQLAVEKQRAKLEPVAVETPVETPAEPVLAAGGQIEA